MKKEKNITININDNENKSETVYNNVINNMNKLSLTKDDQILYLKTRVTELEENEKRGIQVILLSLLFLFLLVCGLFLIIQSYYTVGIIFVIFVFVISIYTTYKLSSNNIIDKSDKFEEIDTIRKIISSKLK